MNSHELAKLLLAGPDLPLITMDSEYGYRLLRKDLGEVQLDDAIHECQYGEDEKALMKQHKVFICI